MSSMRPSQAMPHATVSNPLTLAAWDSLWIAGPCNRPLWRTLAELPALAPWRDALFMASLGLVIVGLTLAQLALGAWPHLVQPLGTMVLYVSVHGESFGENNLYLQGLPYGLAPRDQTHVPMLIRLPSQDQTAARVMRECLRRQHDDAISHDRLFHAVLGLMGVSSSHDRPALDLAALCRNR